MGRLRKLIPRFSLRTLVVFLLLVTSAGWLWWHWGPWRCVSDAAYDDDDLASAITISPDGRRAITATTFKRVAHVRDSGTGRPLVTLNRDGLRMLSVAFSPDGRRVASGHQAGLAFIWDAQTGKRLQLLGGVGAGSHRGPVWSAAFSPDGRRVATAGDDGAVRVWNPERGECLLNISNVTVPGGRVSFSHDGTRLAVVAGRNSAKILSAGDGQCLKTVPLTTLDEPPYRCLSAEFSPDGKLLVVASDLPHIWDIETGRCLAVLILWEVEDGGLNYRATFSPGGDRVVTSGMDNAIQVWDARDGRLLASRSATSRLRSSPTRRPVHIAVA